MLNQDYKEMLQCFDKNHVKHLIVGAYALAAHGFPRSTADIDIWIGTDKRNAAAVYQALAEFGAPLQDITTETFTYPGVVYQIGVAPCRIDILTQISGDLDFKTAYDASPLCNLGDLSVRVLSIQDLITNKSATSRAKDLEDVKTLRRLQDDRREL